MSSNILMTKHNVDFRSRLRLRAHRSDSRVERAGYSLLEILVVLAIIALIAAVVGPRLFAQLDRSKSTTARIQARAVVAALDTMRIDIGRLPSQQEGLNLLIQGDPAAVPGWQGPYMEVLPSDPWGRPYVYAPPAEKTYIIYNTSAYAATIYNSTVLGNTTAAGAGVVIPAGKTMTVWSDGTNFALQNTQFEGTTSTQTFGTNNTTLASTAFVQAALQALHPVGSIYMNATNANNPSTYLGFGTWAAFGAGRVPVGFDAGNALFNTAEETGGSYDATLVSHAHTGTTGTESANHTHSFSGTTSGVGDHQHFPSVNGNTNGYAFGGDTYNVTRGSQDGYYQNTPTTPAGAHSHTYSGNTGGISNNHQHDFTTASSGSSATNANIQPYITVYMWKRTA